MTRILFASSEVYPYIKTGGLADVSGSLPVALDALGYDVRILMPGYKNVLDYVRATQDYRSTRISPSLEIIETAYPNSNITVCMAAHEQFFGRTGNPYLNSAGTPWTDNAERFGFFCRFAVEASMNRLGCNWQPDVVHCNDWQTGLIPALLAQEAYHPATVFTIHNLAYQGLFPAEIFKQLNLPARLWSMHALEFYGQVSFIKGGLIYADRLTTVSPQYAKEIQSDEHGCGLNGLLSLRAERLCGILNGIDEHDWNPESDRYIPHPFSVKNLSGKSLNKQALQERLGLVVDSDRAVLAIIGRLVEQKGIDLVINALPKLLELPIQLVVLGSGDKNYGMELEGWSRLYPEQVSVQLCFDEDLSHQIEAGSDIFLMPSRFEPCGLNQMYSQMYGAPPIVRKVGGLADTVVDANPRTLKDGTATGFVFEEANADALLYAVKRALTLYAQPKKWRSLQNAGMNKDFSWRNSALAYQKIYELALRDRMGLTHTNPDSGEYA